MQFVLLLMPILAFPAFHETPVLPLETDALPPNLSQNNSTVKIIDTPVGRALEIHFDKADWPNIFFAAPSGAWDWSAHLGLAVDVYNPEPSPLSVSMRVDNAGADGVNHCVTAETSANPAEWTTLRALFKPSDAGPFWGMRGIPVLGPIGHGKSIDPAHIVGFQIFLSMPDQPHTLQIRNIRLFALDKPLDTLVPFPFIDRYGQYKHDSWPGKVAEDADLTHSRDTETFANTATPGRDRFGGWTDGPRVEATGWFYPKQIDGAWWLVTPEGHLFLSIGMDCVNTTEQTFVDKRESWFEWLPDPNDAHFGPAWGNVSGAHSMADPISGKGRVFDFYRANLIRKYGDSWDTQWRDLSYKRLNSWGFTTIANWSQQDVLDHSPMPFVASTGIFGEFRRVEGGGGYWGKMPDAYDPAFADAADKSIAPVTQRYAANPLCIGYFVDNELSWEALKEGILASSPDQPCRRVAIDALRHRYNDDIANLNKSWGASAENWDALRAPAKPSQTCRRDLDSIVHDFAAKYFQLVRDAVRKNAPRQLYLGCRFSSAPAPAVKAAAELCDIVSFNRYKHGVSSQDFADMGADRPVVIGEFHFGALDRGMFHTGLVATANQIERAKAYVKYVESVLKTPSVVGCHWFQYVDEPTTGRWYDGENYNIGFVSITDSPYTEMVAAARKVHASMYTIHKEHAAPTPK